jgi:Alpha-glutamyl/putrescinyl thymine pyrophosphorylase clade 3
MPTFCRHNRFVERCPICSKTLPGNEPTGHGARAPRSGRARQGSAAGSSRRVRRDGLKVRHEGRAADDGFSSELVPGLRASADAVRLAAEIEFSVARLAGLAVQPPGLYAEAAALARAAEAERATWICMLIAYIGPAEQDDPFAAISEILAAAPAPGSLPEDLGERLDAAEIGPRGSHQPGSGSATIEAYVHWLGRNGGPERSQVAAFGGDPSWAPERRFARLSERLALPGFTRAGRYELLVTLGRLAVYELRADTLMLAGPAAQGGEDATTVAAKRVFGIGDPILLERRAAALAQAADVPVEVLDLALANWQGPERASMGFRPEDAREHDGTEAPAVSGAIAEALGI